MSNIILITGGGRSGKSSYAQKIAEGLPGKRAFVATCPRIDEEMDERIRKHQDARRESSWDTIEEPLDLVKALRTPGYRVFLVDCLALWVNNLMYDDRKLTEEEIAGKCSEVLGACVGLDATVIFVTNEVGMGIIPDNADARRYRDLLGRCNQVMAAGTDVAVLMACGLPLSLKGILP